MLAVSTTELVGTYLASTITLERLMYRRQNYPNPMRGSASGGDRVEHLLNNLSPARVRTFHANVAANNVRVFLGSGSLAEQEIAQDCSDLYEALLQSEYLSTAMSSHVRLRVIADMAAASTAELPE